MKKKLDIPPDIWDFSTFSWTLHNLRGVFLTPKMSSWIPLESLGNLPKFFFNNNVIEIVSEIPGNYLEIFLKFFFELFMGFIYKKKSRISSRSSGDPFKNNCILQTSSNFLLQFLQNFSEILTGVFFPKLLEEFLWNFSRN